MEMFFEFDPPRAFVRYAKGDDITIVYPEGGYGRLVGEDDTTDYGYVCKYITKYVADIPFEKYEPLEEDESVI
jgi:hypothetical protein